MDILIQKLYRDCRGVYRTDESGEIAVRVRDGSYKIEAFKALKG